MKIIEIFNELFIYILRYILEEEFTVSFTGDSNAGEHLETYRNSENGSHERPTKK
jgi:hypothetical protein